MKDPGSFSIPCNIGPVFIDKALCDLGASVSVMPLSVCRKLNMGNLKVTNITLQMADRTVKYPKGILEDVPVRVGKFFMPVDFVVIDIDEDVHIPIILGRPFLHTAGAVIDVKNGSLTLTVGDDKVTFNLNSALKSPMLEQSCYTIDVIDEIVHDELPRLLSRDPLEAVLCLESFTGDGEQEIDEVARDLAGEELSPKESKIFKGLPVRKPTTSELAGKKRPPRLKEHDEFHPKACDSTCGYGKKTKKRGMENESPTGTFKRMGEIHLLPPPVN